MNDWKEKQLSGRKPNSMKDEAYESQRMTNQLNQSELNKNPGLLPSEDPRFSSHIQRRCCCGR